MNDDCQNLLDRLESNFMRASNLTRYACLESVIRTCREMVRFGASERERLQRRANRLRKKARLVKGVSTQAYLFPLRSLDAMCTVIDDMVHTHKLVWSYAARQLQSMTGAPCAKQQEPAATMSEEDGHAQSHKTV